MPSPWGKLRVTYVEFPCENCRKREYGCTEHCPEYAIAKQQNEQIKASRRVETDFNRRAYARGRF